MNPHFSADAVEMNVRGLRHHPLAVAAALALLGPAAWAQTASGATAPEAAQPEVTVTATGLQRNADELAAPVSVLQGRELELRRAATLGETLSQEPGIQATHFGAGASRPVIRGMDGPRVQVLQNGTPTQDASTLSPDHAVVTEPLLAEQIEVLRGPAALAHGGAVGGVVNVVDRKIPTAAPEGGMEGSAEVRWGSGAREKTGAFSLTGGNGPLVLHVEGLKRDAGEYRVGRGWSGGGKVPGSWAEGENGSVGLSWVGSQGYLGVAYTRQTALYGLPGHDHEAEGCHPHGNILHCGSHDGHDHEEEHAAGDVPVVDLRSNRWDLRGEWRNPVAGIEAVRLSGAFTRYRHDEIEDGEIGTSFRNRANNLRVEVQHAPLWAGLTGVVGVQTGQRRFSAEGEEAYVQPTVTQSQGLFVLEEYKLGDWRWQAALRHDRQTVDAQQDGTSRSHSGNSASLGTVWQFTPGYQASASLTRASRMPTAEELYANGLHLATKTYERGNDALRPETSNAIDLGLRKTEGDTTWRVNVYQHRIQDYIYGRTVDAVDGVLLLDTTQASAKFTGLEAQLRQNLGLIGGVKWGASVFGDLVRARLADGSALPRIAPARLGLRVDARWQGWDAMAEWVQTARQNRVAQFEERTGGYGMLNMAVNYRVPGTGPFAWTLYAKANNLTDRLAYAHTSFTKLDAPLMGRNVTVGVRVDF